ncbi:MAG: hypothetical protein QOF92_783 [Pseudonocardiales bacterium]|nr:hypothetical protein [Pseudonocardiales bacterium]
MSMPPPGPGGPHGYPGQPPHDQPTQQFGPVSGYPDYERPAAPPQFTPGGPPQRPPISRAFTAIWTLSALSLAATVFGLTLNENGHNAWDSVHAWGGVAILGAVLTVTPAVGHSFGLTSERAWQIAACGAGALVLYWVLFVLPGVGTNTSLLTTVGAATGVIAVWIAPGRDAVADSTGAPGADPGAPAPGPQGHTW